VPLGQNEGQAALSALHPLIQSLSDAAVGQGVEAIESAAFGADLAAMRHEGLDVRIFKT
jgi:urease accessory protein